MKARRTPWWHYVLAAMLGLLAGLGFAKYGEITGLPLVGAPWVVPVVLIALGIMVLVLALQVHKYTTKDPLKRAQLKPLDPQKAFGTLVSCKAMGLAGAALTGWYGGPASYGSGVLQPGRHRMRGGDGGLPDRHDHRHRR